MSDSTYGLVVTTDEYSWLDDRLLDLQCSFSMEWSYKDHYILRVPSAVYFQVAQMVSDARTLIRNIKADAEKADN